MVKRGGSMPEYTSEIKEKHILAGVVAGVLGFILVATIWGEMIVWNRPEPCWAVITEHGAVIAYTKFRGDPKAVYIATSKEAIRKERALIDSVLQHLDSLHKTGIIISNKD